MATPRYVVKRIGNDYKIIRADAEGVVLSSLTAAAGALLMVNGMRSGVLNKLLGLAGGGILFYSLTGRNPISTIRQAFGTYPLQEDEHGPSFQHDEKTDAKQKPEDEVDEASMESFPASDPPAHSRTTASA